MTKEELHRSAKFKVGDTAFVNGLEKVAVLKRFYRPTTRTIMYTVQGRWGSLDIAEDRLSRELAGPDHFSSTSTRGRH